MKQKIALLADVHGNKTALEAVIQDAQKSQATEYWFLGDLLMPGPGSNDLFDLLESVNLTAYVRGNWEDCYLAVLAGKGDFTDPSDVYIAKLVQYQLNHLQPKHQEKLANLPIHTTKIINGLSISLSHHLPTKNYGGDLFPTAIQENFDQLLDSTNDLAVYAHTHHPLMRYSQKEQLIINPGSIGQPFNNWPNFRQDMRAQYALLEIDDAGFATVSFKKVAYDREKELSFAKERQLPYLELYQKTLVTGHTFTHELDTLKEINQKYHYEEEVRSLFPSEK